MLKQYLIKQFDDSIKAVILFFPPFWVVFISCIWRVYSHHFPTIMQGKSGTFIVTSMFAGFLASLIPVQLNDKHPFVFVAIILGLFASLSTCYVGLYYFSALLTKSITDTTLSQTWTKVIVSFGLFVAGGIAAWLKKRDKLLYSTLEICFALLANWYGLSSLSKGVVTAGSESAVQQFTIRVALLGGGVYLISRGITNFLEGREEFRLQLDAHR